MFIENAHEGWGKLVITGRFLAWQHSQPEEIQVLADRLIDLYRNDPTARLLIH